MPIMAHFRPASGFHRSVEADGVHRFSGNST
jgi:hypothetical protein